MPTRLGLGFWQLTAKMAPAKYMEYCKARETSFIRPLRNRNVSSQLSHEAQLPILLTLRLLLTCEQKFMEWISLTRAQKSLVQLLAYLAWDRSVSNLSWAAGVLLVC